MRVLIRATMPHEPFNSYVKDGSAGARIQKIMEALKPEAAYFTEMDGKRTALLVVNAENSSQVPSMAEPFFLSFNADVELRIAMRPEDLAAAGLDALGKQWS